MPRRFSGMSILTWLSVMAVCGPAGYVAAFFLSSMGSGPETLPGRGAEGGSGQQPSAAFSPPWLRLSGTDRLISCLNSTGSISAAAWPGMFDSCQDDELLRPVLVREWARKDPGGFWNWIRVRKDPGLIIEAGGAIFESWAAADPVAALAGVARIGSAKLRTPLVGRIIDTVFDHNPAEGLKLLGTNSQLNSIPGSNWIERDPMGALDLLWSLPASAWPRERMMPGALKAVAEKDPAAAISWIEANKPQILPQQIQEALTTAAAGNPEAAVKAISMFPDSQDRDAILDSVTTGALRKLPAEEVIKLIRHGVGEDELQRVMPAIVSTASEKEPALAAGLWTEIPEAARTPYLASVVAGNFVKTDWSAAVSWVEALEEPAFRRQAWQRVSGWTPAGETASMAQRVASMSEGELSDDLLLGIRKAMTKNLGEAATAEWIASLPPLHAQWVKALQN